MKELKPEVPILIISAALERPDGLEFEDGFVAKAEPPAYCWISSLTCWPSHSTKIPSPEQRAASILLLTLQADGIGTITRFLLGLVLTVLGLNGFLHFIPCPSSKRDATQITLESAIFHNARNSSPRIFPRK